MADKNENISEEGAGEDVPSNFFDDFDKDEFLEGLEVIDSLHEDDEKEPESSNKQDTNRRSASSTRLDEYIKPGSRRDPEKTNAAILRDKEVKVKEHLAKHLESQDDLRPPGTELDDYFDDARSSKIKKDNPKNEELEEPWSGPKEHEYHEPPRWRSPQMHVPWRGHREPWRSSHGSARYHSYYSRHGYRRSPGHSPRRSPQYSSRRSPYYRSRHSPRRSPRRSPRFSPRRVSKRSPRRSPRNSPSRSSRTSPGRRYSPQRNHRRSPHRSPRYRSQQDKRGSPRSPRKHSPSQHKPHWNPRHSPQAVSHSDNYMLQPDLNTYNPQYIEQQYNPDISTMSTQYPYIYGESYNPYAVQPVPPSMSMSQSVPMLMNPAPTPVADPSTMMVQPNPVPNYSVPEPVQMVPPPMTSPVISQATTLPNPMQPIQGAKAPHDALAQLVADGKLSKEDYLKLTPSIKGGNSLMDDKTRITVLTRCSQAAEKLNKLRNPFRFMIEKKNVNNEMLCLPEKYTSPLKRQAPVEFEFTKPADQSGTQNKRLINNIITTIGLEKAFRKTKISKDVKSVGVQTTKPYCDMCEIRDSRIKCDVGVSTEALILTNTVHTQVVEQDLLSSKAIFNPRGSVGDSAPISIAHLTPAQLVSQLAARAKTFQQAEPPSTSNQYPRRTQPNSYDGRGGGPQYHPKYQYRY
ncbi:serine/arginine repetitive matrix protein 1 [Manduca sexta]|uniref:serine/arginine repetitive matrix protein 1 n=1 Tax=Manduca sexta TaxID=7130 RepID=UPI00188DC795|nr:serine/arginine repetitive matrix protein 1 [Manduca sexta]